MCSTCTQAFGNQLAGPELHRLQEAAAKLAEELVQRQAAEEKALRQKVEQNQRGLATLDEQSSRRGMG